VLQATNSGVLVEWLQEQGYSIPSDLEPVLQPYLAEHQYFVALKLSSDKDAGDLSPLGLTYCGHAASIPIQLTSVAAIPDLPIEVFVLGPTRRAGAQPVSLPPSANPIGAPRPVTKRPTGRKRGAQVGHRGHARKLIPTEQTDEQVAHRPAVCERCKLRPVRATFVNESPSGGL